MNCALCDYDGQIGDVPSGKSSNRLESREGIQSMQLTPASKIISTIKEQRPDIKIVGFKTTANEHDNSVMEHKAIRMGVDLVLANDVVLRKNMLVNNENKITKYYGNDRDDALIDIASTVKEWVDDETPIKNIRRYDTHTTYWVEVKKSNGRVNAFNKACAKLKGLGINGNYIDNQWERKVQWMYKITIGK